MPELTIEQAFNLALRHHQAGRLREAEQLYRQILAHHPAHVEAMQNLGLIAHQAGQNDAAVELIRRAITLKPDSPIAHNNLGNALKAQGKLDEAIAAYSRAITLKPNYFEAHNNLGIALAGKGQLNEAIAAYHQAIVLNPSLPEAHTNLGVALKDKRQFDESIAAHRRAIALRPDYPEAHNNLGNALAAKGELDEAIAAFRRAIALNPNYADAHNNLSIALADLGQLDEAIATYRRTLALRPDYAEAHSNLGLALLLRGDFAQGWSEYEWRSKCRNFPSPHRDLPQPLWDGKDLKGRAILLYAEQGIGDAIMSIRYLPMMNDRGGRVFVEVQPELIRLLRRLPGVDQWIPRGEPLPPFEVHCPLLSLPHRFVTTLQTIPPQKDLLLPHPDLAHAWRRRIEGHSTGLKIGLAWAGSPTHKNDRNRSIALSQFAPLAKIPGIHFYSLQKGPAAGHAANPPAGMKIIDWTNEFGDFADTAALIANLDLIVSVDTSVAHLAGAMGKPVWLLLPRIPDWRWLLDRDDSPWYPTMRLFRQKTFGGWDEVIQRVAAKLVEPSTVEERISR